jgi:hypothetical protein
MSVALHDHMAKKVYDWHERRYSFLVFENPELPYAGGLMHVPSEWKVSHARASA